MASADDANCSGCNICVCSLFVTAITPTNVFELRPDNLVLLRLALPADHSLKPELARQYETDREGYNKAAREHTKQHAM
jgi:hypothetical protein